MSTSQIPSKVLQKSTSWRGHLVRFPRLQRFITDAVCSGDSYSAVGYDFSSHVPTQNNPLGIQFPGDTYTEFPELPNWVGHLIKTHAPENDWLVFDYAVGGARVHDVGHQVRLGFEKDIADGPSQRLAFR
ncbi:hypothetical protein C8F01DRAFT_1056884 [Mycena amicta]|nr:hypothetical protein C8F01DRAFT_1056884 [Mycena amicta]